MNFVDADGLLAALSGNPDIYPYTLDLISDRVLLVDLPATKQSEALFLDQRALTPSTRAAWCDWRSFAHETQKAATGAPGYIFHVGHCGSTLISRLLSETTGAPALREPLPLRVLATEQADGCDGVSFLTEVERRKRLSLLERLWARRKGVIIKATSICCSLIEDVGPSSPAAFVYIRPEIYLTLLLGGANTGIDLRTFAQMRLRRLRQYWPGAGDLAAMRSGELAAISWLTETAAAASANREIYAVDFDAFLNEPESGLSELCVRLERTAAESSIRSALASPLMRQYAKAPEHPYDASVRAQIIAEDRAKFSDEIASGMKWLEAAAKAFPEGAAAMERFAA